ncbi:MAG: fibronectin type III domain-containing protein [Verrucomicrobia bacterium]|nr:fibronectin type III domain-containing protein [Verrucomicrobiota bacterium]
MVNTIKRTIAFLVALGTKAVAAVAQHAATLSLPHTEGVDLPVKITAVNTSNTAHKQALLEMKNKQAALQSAAKVGRRFMTVLRESLKPTLGMKYSQGWTAVGFAGSLTVPSSNAALLTALQLAEDYLTAHPIADAGANLAPARATLLRGNLAAALIAVAQQKEVVNQAITTRNEKITALDQGLRTLLSELHQVLDPLDARWLAFGFKKPGAKAIPDVPQNVIAVLIGANAISVKWEGAARAAYYRVWKKVIGVDADYVSVGSPADLDFIMEGLPGNSQVEVLVSAMNNGGESQMSTVVLVQTL